MEDHLSTLIAGGCLCIPSETDRLDIEALASFATTKHANWAHITPSLAGTFSPADVPTLKTMVLGGEPMTASNIMTWAQPGCASVEPRGTRLIQVYGPAECCVTSAINSAVSLYSPEMDIGSALPGCALWVARLDNPDFLCPIGAIGELLVEGVSE